MERLDGLAARNGGRRLLAALAVVLVAALALRVGYAIDGNPDQPPDSQAYARIASNLYEHGSFEVRGPGFEKRVQPSSTYSPGLPLFVAGLYYITGGVHLELARVVLALAGAASVLLTYLLGRRLAGPGAGLLAAGVMAVYPALLEYQGLLLSEPLAAFLLVAGLLAFFSAIERKRGGGLGVWAGAGALFAALALVRPEYLPIALALPIVALARAAVRGHWRRTLVPAAAMLAATVVVLVPWTVRNIVVLDRAVPISTGGGKALYIGTYLDADGDPVKLRELLLDERPQLRARLERGGPLDDPDRLVLERALVAVAAREYPNLDVDSALARLGRANLADAATESPGPLAGMFVSKAFHSWTDAARSVMLDAPWRALQLAVLLLALVGLGILAWERRSEALVLGLILAYVSAISALLIASPRRELVVLPVLAALAGAGAIWLVGLALRPTPASGLESRRRSSSADDPA